MFHNSSTRSVANVPDITMICARASSVVTITTKDTNITGLENSNRYTRGYLKEFQRQVLQHTLDTVFKFCRHFVSIMKKKDSSVEQQFLGITGTSVELKSKILKYITQMLNIALSVAYLGHLDYVRNRKVSLVRFSTNPDIRFH